MSQDYDSPRGKDDVESFDIGKNTRTSPDDVDDDENAIAGEYELDVADPVTEDPSVTVIPMQKDEFLCVDCYLVRHRSQLGRTDPDGKQHCKECLGIDDGPRA